MATASVKDTPLQSERERAKQIITEIIRCAGGSIEGKTRLFKVFYLAHLFYAESCPDYLSDWPIVRMPHGPGIGDADELFSAMKREGLLEIREKRVGPYPAFEFRTLAARVASELSLDAIKAIRQAVDFVAGMTASELSELTHQYSHCWKRASDGETLNIYIDLLDEAEYAEMSKRVEEDIADWKALGN